MTRFLPHFALPVALVALAGCAAPTSDAASPSSPTVVSASPSLDSAPRGAAAYVRDVTPWRFDGAEGRIIKTDHFAIYTTSTAPAIAERLPGFVEAALRHYTTAIVPLDYPDSPMESFFMATRPQWQAVSLQLIGPRAKPLTQIRRGGFATMGRGFYFDIGVYDTLAVAGHEGWHQFTQRTFHESLPLWLEEGVATFMEGHRWENGSPRFLPWANVERFDRLREAVSRNQLITLQELLGTGSDQLLAGGGAAGSRGLTYYAQLWALAHFLNEGENGRYKPALQKALTDAAAGKFASHIAATLGADASRPLVRISGAAAFAAYFDRDLARFNTEYMAFIRQIVATGGREAIVEGRSPIAAPAR